MRGTSSRPDFGKVARDYARHRAPFPAELYDRLARGFNVGLPGQRILDVGTGTGAVALALARRRCVVTGLDPSPELLAEAQHLSAADGLDVHFVQGVAEATGFSEGAFDVVTAAVCWHWFDAERAAAEIRRVLAPGGKLVIVHLDWLSWPDNVVAATEDVLRRHRSAPPGVKSAETLVKKAVGRVRPAWIGAVGTGLHPQNLTTLTAAGFVRLESFSFDVDLDYDQEGWRGRVRSHALAGASKSATAVERIDAELGAVLREKFGDARLVVPHRIFVIVGRNP